MIQIENQNITFVNETDKNVTFTNSFIEIPSISAIPVARNVEIFVSNLTTTGCTLNASAAFSGVVRVVAMRG